VHTQPDEYIQHNRLHLPASGFNSKITDGASSKEVTDE